LEAGGPDGEKGVFGIRGIGGGEDIGIGGELEGGCWEVGPGFVGEGGPAQRESVVDEEDMRQPEAHRYRDAMDIGNRVREVVLMAGRPAKGTGVVVHVIVDARGGYVKGVAVIANDAEGFLLRKGGRDDGHRDAPTAIIEAKVCGNAGEIGAIRERDMNIVVKIKGQRAEKVEGAMGGDLRGIDDRAPGISKAVEMHDANAVGGKQGVTPGIDDSDMIAVNGQTGIAVLEGAAEGGGLVREVLADETTADHLKDLYPVSRRNDTVPGMVSEPRVVVTGAGDGNARGDPDGCRERERIGGARTVVGI